MPASLSHRMTMLAHLGKQEDASRLDEMLRDMPDPNEGSPFSTVPRDGSPVMIWHHRYRAWRGPFAWTSQLGGAWRALEGSNTYAGVGALSVNADDMLRWKRPDAIS